MRPGDSQPAHHMWKGLMGEVNCTHGAIITIDPQRGLRGNTNLHATRIRLLFRQTATLKNRPIKVHLCLRRCHRPLLAGRI